MSGTDQAVSGRLCGKVMELSFSRLSWAFCLAGMMLCLNSAAVAAGQVGEQVPGEPIVAVADLNFNQDITDDAMLHVASTDGEEPGDVAGASSQPSKAAAILSDAAVEGASLIGMGAQDLLGDVRLPGAPSDGAESLQPFVFPASAPPPITIPFPTAVHLFVPGAIMAIYFTRKYRRRRG